MVFFFFGGGGWSGGGDAEIVLIELWSEALLTTGSMFKGWGSMKRNRADAKR